MPDSQKVRARKWLRDEIKKHRPPPSQKEIRRRMGWDILEMQRKEIVKKRRT